MINLELVKENESIELELEQNSKGGTKNYNELDNKPTINGKTLQGNLTLEDLGIIVNAVKDILVNGASIIDKNGNAVIPIATVNQAGVGIANQYYGIEVKEHDKIFRIVSAKNNEIDVRTNEFKPIVPKNLPYAIKSAMSSVIDEEWTSEEKANARARMGLEWRLIDTMEVSDVANVEITFPQEYSEFMVIADIKGNGTSVVYPIGGYFNADEPNHLKGYTLPFTDFYPSTNDEHYELVFEKMNIENDTFLKISGFESTNYAKKMKQNIQSTGWLQQYNVTNEHQCHCWYGVKFQRTITNATFKIFAR